MTNLAQLAIEALRALEIDTLYCIPGVQNDLFFNELVDAPDIRPVVCRHEQGTAYMAAGASLVTGKPAACSVVPGPGLLNASAALTTGYWGGANVFAIVGEIATRLMDKNIGTLHELPNQHAILQQLTKHAELITDGQTAVSQMQAAIDALVNGAPHPVSVEIPVDRWLETATGALSTPVRTNPTLDPAVIDQAAQLIANAKNPLIVVGSGAWEAADEVRALAELLQAPVTTRRMGHGVLPNDHPHFVPLAVAHSMWVDVDVAIGIGTRLEWPIDVWGIDDDLSVVQIDIDPNGLDRHHIGSLGVHADAAEGTQAIIDAIGPIAARSSRTAEFAEFKAQYVIDIAHLEPQLGFLGAIHDVLPADGVIVEDVCQIGFAAHIGYNFNQPRTFLSSGPAGTLGAGVGMGIGAADAARDKSVITVSGDGGFLFGATEMATAVQHDIPTKILVFNNSAYGNVRRIQTQRFGADRTIASTLRNPNLMQFADSFGFATWQAHSPDDLRTTLDAALSHDGPAFIEIPHDPLPDPWPFMRLSPGRRGK
ncbi:MAG: thiamine pyrophosphate-dependent enzyme [Acidimicrobiales bacterium]